MSQRLRGRDGRVLGESYLMDARSTRRWKYALGIAILAALVMTLTLVDKSQWVAIVLLPGALSTAFQAGRRIAEYEGATGKTILRGKKRAT